MILTLFDGGFFMLKVLTQGAKVGMLGRQNERISSYVGLWFNLNGAGGGDCACTFFRRLFLHEKRGLDVRNFLI